jgi:hypothetical protein
MVMIVVPEVKHKSGPALDGAGPGRLSVVTYIVSTAVSQAFSAVQINIYVRFAPNPSTVVFGSVSSAKTTPILGSTVQYPLSLGSRSAASN